MCDRRSPVIFSLAGSFVALLVGCAPHRDLIGAGQLRLEQVPPSDGSLQSVCAHERGEGLAVSGTWRHRPLHGHVDVTLFSPEGEVLAETRTRLVMPVHRQHRHPTRFYTQLDVVPPPGSTLRVVRHDKEHSR